MCVYSIEFVEQADANICQFSIFPSIFICSGGGKSILFYLLYARLCILSCQVSEKAKIESLVICNVNSRCNLYFKRVE